MRYIDRQYGRAALRDLLTARSTTAILTRLGVGEAELLTAWRADPSDLRTARAVPALLFDSLVARLE